MFGVVVASPSKQKPRPEGNERNHAKKHEGRVVGEHLKNFLRQLLADRVTALLLVRQLLHQLLVEADVMEKQEIDSR